MRPETDQDLLDTDLYEAPEPILDVTDTGRIVATDHEGSLLRGLRRQVPPAPPRRAPGPVLRLAGAGAALAGVWLLASVLGLVP